MPVFYKKKALKQAETHYMDSIPSGHPYIGPVSVHIEFSYPWRKAEPKKNRVDGRKWKNTKPDLDNSAKTLIDCLAKRGHFSDDAQIAELTVMKVWSDSPGTRIKIEPLDDYEQ